MQNLKQIELELWEPNPDKHAYLRFVGCRKAKEVFNELYAELQRLDLVPDEYFTMFFRIEENTLVPKDARVVAYANWGGSEGIYIDVDLIGKDEALHLATGKTLSESTEAFDRMQYIAGVIYKMFTSPGFSASELTIKSEMTNAEEKLNAVFSQLSSKILHHNSDPLSYIVEISDWLELANKIKAGALVGNDVVRALAERIDKGRKEGE